MPYFKDDYWWFEWDGETYGPYTTREKALTVMDDLGGY